MLATPLTEKVSSQELTTDPTIAIRTSRFESLDFGTQRSYNEKQSNPLRDRYQALYNRLQDHEFEKLDISWREGRLLFAALRDEANHQDDYDDILSSHIEHDLHHFRQYSCTDAPGKADIAQCCDRLEVDITSCEQRPNALELQNDKINTSHKLKKIADRCMQYFSDEKMDCSMNSLALVRQSRSARVKLATDLEPVFEGILSKYTAEGKGDMDNLEAEIAIPLEGKCSPISIESTTRDISQINTVPGDPLSTPIPNDTIKEHQSSNGSSPLAVDSVRMASPEETNKQTTRQSVSPKHIEDLVRTNHMAFQEIESVREYQEMASRPNTVTRTPYIKQSKTSMIADCSIQPRQSLSNDESHLFPGDNSSDCIAALRNKTDLSTENTQRTESNGIPQPRNPVNSPMLEEPRNKDNCTTQMLDISPAKGLGSLSTFMESRGISHSSPLLTGSYLAMSTPTTQPPENDRSFQGTSPYTSVISSPEMCHISDTTSVQVAAAPYIKDTSDDLILVLATDLLKSHLKVIQYLEQLTSSPKLLYRDYNQPEIEPSIIPGQFSLDPVGKGNVQVPQEADIIVSPTTGIILTTTYALTQLYLPGQRPNETHLPRSWEITSPVLERIFRIAPRYERVYVLACHSGKPLSSLGSDGTQTLEANKQTKDAAMSLVKFCKSISEHATVIPQLIASAPETIATWALALAAENKVQLPVHDRQGRPIRQFDNSPITMQQVIQDEETREEFYLRTMGFNPFAARLVLDMMDKSRRDLSFHDSPTQECLFRTNRRSSSMSLFIEMDPADRNAMFEDLVGKHLLSRIYLAIEGRDLFYSSTELGRFR